jgi:hypothetical protein
MQRFECLRVTNVAAVGNLSLQGYPDIVFPVIVRFWPRKCTDANVSFSTLFASYRIAIIAIDLKMKR